MQPDADKLLQQPVPPITPGEASEVAKSLFGVEGEATPLEGERDRNFLIEGTDGSFSLKFANPVEGSEVLSMQAAALEHIARVDPGLPVPQSRLTIEGRPVGLCTIEETNLPVRMVDYLPGITLEQGVSSPSLRHSIGSTLGRLGYALRGFVHPAAGRVLLWDLQHLSLLRSKVHYLDKSQKELVEQWLDRFDTHISPRLAHLRAQIIHNDFNPENLLVVPAAPNRISGIIDFGDMVHSPLITDLAVAASYQILTDDDPTTAIAEMAAAYHGTVPLEPAEIELLPELAACRLVQSLLVGAWRVHHHTDNTDYILSYSDSSWTALQRFSALDGEELIEAAKTACRSQSVRPSAPHDLPTLLDRRRRRLGSGMRLSYDEPLHAVAGDGVWLIDAAGIRHLDAYNNVPHVGHSHPVVTAAIAHQSATLNTNTRYLVDGVLDYADRLAGLFPDDLSVVMFANSGSEANDLAWRIARTVTGNDGMIVTRHAYHGATNLTIATSPEEIGLENLESWVATVPAPDPRLPMSNHLEQALSDLSTANHRPAAFACDTVFSSDGIFEPEAGFFSSTASQIRAAGGLFIADEVQAGFGRVGERLWGFAADDFVPDIVTIGKPMGNGHPIAAIVTTPAIADAFIEKGYYFSTFAGNPVSTAAAMAVLDVMEAEDLPAKAHRVGSYLRGQLQNLAQRYPSISDVRGPGMFIGVELAIDGRPDPEGATRVVNEMRNQRVLIGRTGLHGNVLKVRPPLAFDESHADLLVQTLNGVLADR